MEIEKFIYFGVDGKSKKRLIEKFKNSWKSIRTRNNLYVFSWFVKVRRIKYLFRRFNMEIYSFLSAFPDEKYIKILSVYLKK